MRCSRCVIAALALSFTGAAPAVAGPGDLDPTFSGDGKAVTDLGGVGFAGGVALQADGSVLVAGSSSTGAAGNFGLVRYTAAGALDTSYAGDGTQTADFGAFESGNDVALQSDGKAIVVGRSSTGGGDFLVARYNTDGSLDTSFSGDGFEVTNFAGASVSDAANEVAIQPDGRIVVAGGAAGSGFAIARYTSSGALDTTFSLDGKASAFTGSAAAFGLVLQPDGAIVVAGASNSDFAVARLTAAGTLDPSFSGDGQQTTDVGGFNTVGGLALQPDGKTVVVGTVQTGSGATRDVDFALARYDAGGELDPTFDGDGTATAGFPTADPAADSDRDPDVALQPDGAIVAVGSVGVNDFDGTAIRWNQVGLARFTPGGALDPSFSDDGRQTTTIDTGDTGGDRGIDVAIQGDGRIVVAADAGVPTAIVDAANFAALRYGDLGGPTPTPTPTAVPSVSPTATPTVSPTATPVATPTVGPYGIPSPTPTAVPTLSPFPTFPGDPLTCTTRRVVLEDAVPSARGVRLLGLADAALAGERVEIAFVTSGATVASAVVQTDGRFTARAPLPPRAARRLRKSAYVAAVGPIRSKRVFLNRRMYVDSATSALGQVTIKGRVVGALAPTRKLRTIRLRRFLDCRKAEVVATFQPKRSGAFTVTVPAPLAVSGAVYQLNTKVRRGAKLAGVKPALSLRRSIRLL